MEKGGLPVASDGTFLSETIHQALSQFNQTANRYDIQSRLLSVSFFVTHVHGATLPPVPPPAVLHPVLHIAGSPSAGDAAKSSIKNGIRFVCFCIVLLIWFALSCCFVLSSAFYFLFRSARPTSDRVRC